MEGNGIKKMDSKRPYKHILKNLLHEQATEIIPLLQPDYQIEEVLKVEMPDVRSTPLERPPSDLEKGLVGLVLPEAEVVEVYETEWIEHSGNFERVYRFKTSETDKPCYLVIEFQTEHEDEKDLPRRLLANFARVNRYVSETLDSEDDEEEDESKEVDVDEEDDENEDESDGENEDEDESEGESKGTIMNIGYYVYPVVLCPFPQNVPAHIREEFHGKVMLAFNFMTINLWEKDAREFLNTQVSATFFLLPAMKNADASLLGLAIEELTRRFKDDENELGRHLTGMNMMLQESDMMSAEEKLAAQKHLERFAHLIKHDPYDE